MIGNIILRGLLVFFFAWAAQAKPSPQIYNRIISQGVPVGALRQLVEFMDTYRGTSFVQDIYTCAGSLPESTKPCEEKKRTRAIKSVTLDNPRWSVIIDYGAPSTLQRLYLIDFETGDVHRTFAAHGSGTGKTEIASKFSNIKDSKQTSLGIYMAGETYSGKYGLSLRMYGLQGANNMAFHRDIVMHGAWYANGDFIGTKDPKTGLPFNRLGLSWGCPAVPLNDIKNLIGYIQNGGLIMHYHSLLMDAAQSGAEVTAP
jgi:hypothetical protein